MEKRGEFNSSKNILIRLILKMMAETVNGPYKRQPTLAISWVVQPSLVSGPVTVCRELQTVRKLPRSLRIVQLDINIFEIYKLYRL